MKDAAFTPSFCVLRQRAEFLSAAQSGKKWVSRNFIMQIGAPPKAGEKPTIRYGLTASKKIGNAVTRNRARRRLRALATEIIAAHARPGYDYVLIARATTPECEFAVLRQDLTTALHRLKLWRDET